MDDTNALLDRCAEEWNCLHTLLEQDLLTLSDCADGELLACLRKNTELLLAQLERVKNDFQKL